MDTRLSVLIIMGYRLLSLMVYTNYRIYSTYFLERGDCLSKSKSPKRFGNTASPSFSGLLPGNSSAHCWPSGGAAGLQATIGRLQCWPFGASNRTSVPALLAGGPEARQAVGVYFLLQPYVGTEEIGWMCILAAAPFAACGFFRYHFKKQEVSPRKRSSKNRIPNSPGRRRPPVSPRPP